ncbi:MAG: hypothetical protein SFY32_11685 [Bacteroidota bacterium]|nr:hypothetical protein [Bacteroidota bacterium]
MFDGFKLQLPYFIKDSLLNNPLLEFKGKFSLKNGDLQTEKLIAKYPVESEKPLLTFIIKGNYIELIGSFHKYWQHGTNFQDYTFTDLVNTILELQNKFGLNPNECLLHNLEIGLNFELLYLNANEFLNNCMLYKCHTFDSELFSSKGNQKRAKLAQYQVKIYNKGLQNLLSENLIRIELKIKKMALIGNATLADITNLKFIEKASFQLLDVWNAVIYWEKIDSQNKVSKPIEKLLYNWGNSKYLHELVNNQRKLKYEREKYRKIIKENCSKSVHNQIQEMMFEKLLEFSNEANQKNCTDFTKIMPHRQIAFQM